MASPEEESLLFYSHGLKFRFHLCENRKTWLLSHVCYLLIWLQCTTAKCKHLNGTLAPCFRYMPVFIYFFSRNSMSPSCHVLFTLLFFHRPQRDMSSPLVPPHYLNTLFFHTIFSFHHPSSCGFALVYFACFTRCPGGKALATEIWVAGPFSCKTGLVFLVRNQTKKARFAQGLKCAPFFWFVSARAGVYFFNFTSEPFPPVDFGE